MINDRIRTLRRQSVEAQASLSPERALLVTELLQSGRLEGEAVPIQRAHFQPHPGKQTHRHPSG